MTSLHHMAEIVVLMLGAYVFGCGFGFWARRLPHLQPVKRSEPVAKPEAMTAPLRSAARRLAAVADPPTPAPLSTTARPPALPAPLRGGKDDLRKIKGIGPKTESSLNDLGVYHFHQIAAWTPANIDWLEGRIAIKGRIRREQWVEQAVLLATATKAA
jgi:predicted flap endonuclease-1-like 5' DNA nuclease